MIYIRLNLIMGNACCSAQEIEQEELKQQLISQHSNKSKTKSQA